jgi:hypothetical protein
VKTTVGTTGLCEKARSIVQDTEANETVKVLHLCKTAEQVGEVLDKKGSDFSANITNCETKINTILEQINDVSGFSG